jgi:exopolyphosphatase/guanosine-5'-triphosphate,3'-diphosphate pyrophosphatase
VRIAALDLGSSSFHLVVADTALAAEGPRIEVVAHAKEMVRIGEATLLSGHIPSDGFGRGLDALATLRRTAEQHKPEAFLVAATSAIREASNGVDFVRAGRKVTGAEIRVIDGHEEARLIYLGARAALRLAGRRVALFDLGGGSLELVVASEERVLLTASVKLGVLRLKEAWLGRGSYDRVSPEMRVRVRQDIERALLPMTSAARHMGFDFVAFTSGTARTLWAMATAAAPADSTPSRELTVDSLVSLENTLASLPAPARARLPGVDERRIDTLLPGAIVLRTVLELCGYTAATYCDAALREGMITAYLAGSW